MNCFLKYADGTDILHVCVICMVTHSWWLHLCKRCAANGYIAVYSKPYMHIIYHFTSKMYARSLCCHTFYYYIGLYIELLGKKVERNEENLWKKNCFVFLVSFIIISLFLSLVFVSFLSWACWKMFWKLKEKTK